MFIFAPIVQVIIWATNLKDMNMDQKNEARLEYGSYIRPTRIGDVFVREGDERRYEVVARHLNGRFVLRAQRDVDWHVVSNQAEKDGWIRLPEALRIHEIINNQVTARDGEDYKPSPYRKKIRGVCVDIYDICTAFPPVNSAVEHLIKKLLVTGKRSGGKSVIQDLKDAIWSLERAIILEEEKASGKFD